MRHRGQTRPEKSGNVVHSAARQRSMLCRSTTYRAQQASRHGTVAVSAAPAHPARRIACRWRGSRGRRSVGRSRPQRAIYCAIEAKKYSAHSGPGLGAGPPAQPTPERPDPRARTGCIPWWEWEEGTVGDQECQESVRRFARDVWSCNARRALGGVWWSHTRWARTQRNRRSQIDC
jgi:hypothetical protein